MKPINISEDDKLELMKKFVMKFKEELDKCADNINDTKIKFETSLTETAKEKVKIIYSQEAYLRMQALVDYFDTEVGWYGLVEKINDLTYRVYDVKLCKQYVNGAKVDTDDDDTLEFFESLTDDEADHLHFQAHSHVKMSTSASGVDLQNQADVVKNIGKTGFYIFQIWNKNNDINTYLYDLDNNLFYDKKDVELIVEDKLGTLEDFVASVKNLVVEKKYYVWPEQKGKGKKANTYPDYPMYNGYYYGGDWL